MKVNMKRILDESRDAIPEKTFDCLATGRFYASFLRSVGVVTDGRVLDFGCGDGHIAAALAEEGAKVTGVEAEEKWIRRTGMWNAFLKDNPISVVSCREFLERREEYDLCILRDVVEHLEDEAVLDALLSRVGRVFLTTPNRFSIPLLARDPHNRMPFCSIMTRDQVSCMNRVLGRSRRWGAGPDGNYHRNYYDVQLYSLARIRAVLERKGFGSIRNLTREFYSRRQGRRALACCARLLPAPVFENIVAPTIVLYAVR